MLRWRVTLLDDTQAVWELERNAVGQELFHKVCESLNLLEKDYYGLAIWDRSHTKKWLDLNKEIRKQVQGSAAALTFNVKFYPPDPEQLAEDITRYLLCLQLRKDLHAGRVPCPSQTLALLGSYVSQSEFGDYDPDLHGNSYLNVISFLQNQNPSLLENVINLHRSHKAMSPSQADLLFLENAKQLHMYGVDLHPAEDEEGHNVHLGVCSEGLKVFDAGADIESFPWTRILSVSCKRNSLRIRIRPSETVNIKSTVGFRLATYRASKSLWKICVEHHSFFRNRHPGDVSSKGFCNMGSRFRYHGRTHSESLEDSSNITRPAPSFPRSAINRSGGEKAIRSLMLPTRTESDDWHQMLFSAQSHKITIPDTQTDTQTGMQSSADRQTGPQTQMMSREWEGLREEEEWHELLFRQPFHPVTLVSDGGMAQDIQLQQWMEVEDDWFVLLRGWQSESSLWTLDTPPFSPPGLVQDQQEEELILEEKQSEGEVTEENLPEMASLEKSLGETEVVEKILQEVECEEKDQQITTEINIKRVEIVKRLQKFEVVEVSLKTSEMEMEDVEKQTLEDNGVIWPTSDMSSPEAVFEEQIEDVEVVEKRLQEVETIQQMLQEVDQILQEQGQQVEEEGGQQEGKDYRFVLLSRSPIGLSTDHAESPTFEELEEKKTERAEWKELELLREGTPPERVWEDDWFILLDTPRRGRQHIPPATVEFEGEKAEDIAGEAERTMKNEDERGEHWEQVVVEERRAQPILLEQGVAQSQREVEDDWFVLLDVSPKESVTTIPPVSNIIAEERRAEIMIEERRAEERVMKVEEERKQQEPMILEERKPQPVLLEQIVAQSQREVEDDLIVLLDVPPKETVVTIPPVAEIMIEERRAEEREMKVEEERKQQGPVILEERKPQPILLEQIVAQSQREVEDDWLVLLDVSPKESVTTIPPVSNIIAEERRAKIMIEERRAEEREMKVEEERKQQESMILEERKPQPVLLEQIVAQSQREVEDDLIVLLDVSPKESVPWVPRHIQTTAIEDTYEAPTETEQKTEKRVTIVDVRVTEKLRNTMEEEKTTFQQTPVVSETQNPVTPRDVADDWFELLHSAPIEERTRPLVAALVSERENIVFSVESERRTAEERGMGLEVETRVKVEERKQQEQVVVEERGAPPALLEQRGAQPQREVEDDWFVLLDVSPKESVTTIPPVSNIIAEERIAKIMIEERRAEEREMKVEEERKQQESMILEERKPQPVLLEQIVAQSQREVEDDLIVLLDVFPKESVPWVPRHIQTTAIEDTYEAPTETEQKTEKRVTIVDVRVTEKLRNTMEEEKTTFQQTPVVSETQNPVTPRDVADDWFELLHSAPIEERTRPLEAALVSERENIVFSVESERRTAEERGMRLEVETRVKVEERKQREQVTLEERGAPPALLEQRGAQPQREVEDDWFVLLDVSPKESVPLGDQPQLYSREIRGQRRLEEKTASETERRKQEIVVVRETPPVLLEHRVVRSQREVVDDWFVLLDASSRESAPPPAPVISPVAVPKARSLPTTDQPLTSTPTERPAPLIRPTYQEVKKMEIPKPKPERVSRRIEGETIYIRHSILMLEDFDVTQEVVLRHHASISELKRLFMEATPEPAPCEWERRLSSHTPLRLPTLALSNGHIHFSWGPLGNGITAI